MKMNFKSVKQMNLKELMEEVFDLRSQVQVLKDALKQSSNEVLNELVNSLKEEKTELLNKLNELVNEKELLIKEYADRQLGSAGVNIVDYLMNMFETLWFKITNKLTSWFNNKTNNENNNK